MTDRPCRTLVMLHVLIACAAVLLSAPQAGAAGNGESAADYVQPYVTRLQYQTLLESLNLDRDQRSIADSLYADYSSTIDEAVAQTNQQAVAAGRSTIEDVFAGRKRLSAEELRRLRVEVLKAYTSIWPAVDDAFKSLLDFTSAILIDSQLQKVEPKLRALRRAVYLDPVQQGRFTSDYAGEGVCILDLVAEAQKDGGELAEADRRQLRALLDPYELQLDSILRNVADQMRDAPVARRMASMAHDERALRAANAKMLQPWQQMYELNRRTAQAIAALAPTPDDRQRWLDRFNRECFPWLLSDERPDRQYAWLSKQSLPAETWANIEQTYSTYRQQRRTLSQSMIELMVNARLTIAVPLHPMMDPTEVPDAAADMYEQLIRMTGQETATLTQATDAFNAALTETQRRAMNRAVR